MMQGRELKPLKLPQLVEASRREEQEQGSMASPISAKHSHQVSHTSTSSDVTMSTSPTASSRHSRLPSSTTSLPSSPSLHEFSEEFAATTTTSAAKRPLTEVQEEPTERDGDFVMLDVAVERQLPAVSSSREMSGPEWTLDDPVDMRFLEYDPADESDLPYNPVVKKQRADIASLEGIASKISAIKPSLSRRWKSRRTSPTVNMPGASREPSLSRANSTRAPSFASVTLENSRPYSTHYPPTPARSALDESLEVMPSPVVDGQLQHDGEEQQLEEWQDQAKPTTPLLPPLLTAVIPDHIKDVPYQSPLQSPSVAEPEAYTFYQSPVASPQMTHLPSPPLSTKPSIASFHRNPSLRGQVTPAARNSVHIVPSSEIPPHPLDSHQDEWTDILGHANFHIIPEPYCPAHPTPLTCQKLRQDWAVATQAFNAHSEHVAEHYGPTSKTFLSTQVKWSTIDSLWKRNVEACAAAEAITGDYEDDDDYYCMDNSAMLQADPMDIEAAEVSPPSTLKSETSANVAAPKKTPSSINSPVAPAHQSPTAMGERSLTIVPITTNSTASPVVTGINPTTTASPPLAQLPTPVSPTTPMLRDLKRQPSLPQAAMHKLPAKFPTPGEGGIVGPMEVIAARAPVLEAHLDRSEANAGDLGLGSGSGSGQGSGGSSKRKRKWGSVFHWKWMMDKFSANDTGRVAARV